MVFSYKYCLNSLIVSKGSNIVFDCYKYEPEAFFECLYLKEIILPSSVTSLPPHFYVHNNDLTVFAPKDSYVASNLESKYAKDRHRTLNTTDYETKVLEYE